MAEPDFDRETWFERYEQIIELEKIILQLMSIHCEEMDAKKIFDCLVIASVKGPHGVALSQKDVNQYLRLLEKQGLIHDNNGSYSCPEPCAEELTLQSVVTNRFTKLCAAIRAKNSSAGSLRRFSAQERPTPRSILREWRIAVYQQQWKESYQILERWHRLFPELRLPEHPYFVLFRNVYDLDWLFSLPNEFLERAFLSIFSHSAIFFEPYGNVFDLLEMYCLEENAIISPILRDLWVFQMLLAGNLSRIQEIMENDPELQKSGWAGCLRFLQGKYEEALLLLEQAWGGRHIKASANLHYAFLCLLWMRQNQPTLYKKAETCLLEIRNQTSLSVVQAVGSMLKFFLAIIEGKETKPQSVFENFLRPNISPLQQWFCAMILFWLDAADHEILPKLLPEVYERARRCEFYWIVSETAEMLGRLQEQGKVSSPLNYREIAQSTREQMQTKTIVDLCRTVPLWERSLQEILSLGQRSLSPEKDSVSKGERLVWFLPEIKKQGEIFVRVQKITGRGKWGVGRKMELERLWREYHRYDFLLEQDKHILSGLDEYEMYSYRYSSHAVKRKDVYKKIILGLLGHPFVFWEDDPNTSIELLKGEPIVRVIQEKNSLRLMLEPPLEKQEEFFLLRETATRVQVYELSPSHLRLSEILGPKGLQVPVQAQQQVLDVIGSIAPLVTIHSDIGGTHEEVTELPVDPKLYVHLIPWNQRLKVNVMVFPLGEKGPRFLPADGPVSVFARIDNQAFHTTREIDHEKTAMDALLESCPILLQHPNEHGEWFLDELEQCLDLVVSLQSVGENVIVRWPQGQNMRVKKRLSSDQMRWDIRGQNEWFEVNAQLDVDEGEVLELQSLLKLMELSPGRFLQLKSGEFIALTEEFRRRLDDFRSFSQDSGKQRRVHASAAFAVEELLQDASNVDASKHWKEHCERLRSVSQKQFKLPKELKATLRDYQEEGFQWLSRMAHWRFGACLSDEMGLGKTLQALALLLSRAPDGPALVVAPTSVCLNWIDEASRFAPKLRMISFATSDRQSVLDELQPFDVVVCSYTLLQTENENLKKVPWYSVVLDEAQAIKNSATKRSKAAMQLMSDFKMITTGTPIENHLGEFWNLFTFLNPGLLGGFEHFQRTFISPIERSQNAEVRDQLKRLVQPFVLRRRKMDVVKELPSRTEIILHVEMSKPEMALYEALRQKALEKIAQTNQLSTGEQHLHILAELTRLRQACCHPQLVLPESEISSSKLQLLEDTLEELLENQHKVLIFSQFVTHLNLIRAMLEQKEISYQYLDGSTPARERKKRIDAFQAGTGDIFLLSLKAGGFGINLTAADYVIHMDPWWNPAVEDQASDRAHRIGQTRPVTIYRMITRHTVEEKIVSLHQRKRDLAESLLDGSDMTGKMSTDELISLIRDRS